MQVLFKTSYDQDISHLPQTGEKVRVGLAILAACVAPLFLGTFLTSELALFLVYVLAGLGLMVLRLNIGRTLHKTGWLSKTQAGVRLHTTVSNPLHKRLKSKLL